MSAVEEYQDQRKYGPNAPDILDKADAAIAELLWACAYNAGVAFVSFVAADDAMLKAASADEWMESCRLLAEELAELKAQMQRIDQLVSEVPKTGDADSAVMDIMRVVCEWAAREETP